MSCNGCRVLRKGCSETCILRSCLQWIPTPQAQANATLFLAKFFGRSDLMSLISAVPVSQRPALFQSLLFEACGRTVNPVNGAVGLLWSGNWHMCQAAVETILAGGILQPLPGLFAGLSAENYDEASSGFKVEGRRIRTTTWQQSRPSINVMLKGGNQVADRMNQSLTQMFCSGGRETTLFFTGESGSLSTVECNGDKKELLNLFV